MKIDYKNVTDFIGWDKAEEYVQKIIKSNNYRSILELGAGANPTISPKFININKITYTISDIDSEELAKADDIYIKEVLNLNTKEVFHSKKYDLIFSRMVGEHISNGYYYHRNIYSLLNPGGMAFHCFSTLYSIPFLINWLIPETFSEKLLDLFTSRDKYKHGKFKAYYSWCRGPSKKMINKFENIGYDVIEYIGYFGHNYYKKIPILNLLERNKTMFLIRNHISFLTAYAHVIIKKSNI